MDPTTDAFGDVCDFLAGIICSAEHRADRVAAYLQQNKRLGAWCRRKSSPPQRVREVLMALDLALQLEACESAGAQEMPDYDFPGSDLALAQALAIVDDGSAQFDYRVWSGALLLWSARHLTWTSLQDRPLLLDSSIGNHPHELLMELAELLLTSLHSLPESKTQ